MVTIGLKMSTCSTLFLAPISTLILAASDPVGIAIYCHDTRSPLGEIMTRMRNRESGANAYW